MSVSGNGFRSALIGAGGVAFIGAGVLMVLAAAQPWSDLVDGWGGTDSGFVQDHYYDYLLPTGSSWLPFPAAGLLSGAAMVTAACAFILVFVAVPSPVWSRIAQVATVGSLLVLGLTALTAGRADSPDDPWWWWCAVWLWAVPVPLIAVVVQWVGERGRARPLPAWAWLSWLAAVLLATPVPKILTMPGIIAETAPGLWEIAVGGLPWILAGVVLLVALVRASLPGRVPAPVRAGSAAPGA